MLSNNILLMVNIEENIIKEFIRSKIILVVFLAYNMKDKHCEIGS